VVFNNQDVGLLARTWFDIGNSKRETGSRIAQTNFEDGN